MCWMITIGKAAKQHTTTQLAVVRKYMSRGRRWASLGRPGSIIKTPATRQIRLDQRKALRSSWRSNSIRVSIGIVMLTARVMRKMPRMKPMMRRVERAMTSAWARRERGRHSTRAAGAVNQSFAVAGWDVGWICPQGLRRDRLECQLFDLEGA